jgi:hypothetical protein
MSIEIRDEKTAAELKSADRAQDVRTADGQFLGRFVPAKNVKMSCPELGLSDEEIQARLNDPNAEYCTPEQVMARLREIDRCSI